MAAIEQIDLTGALQSAQGGLAETVLKALVARQFWGWYDAHRRDRIKVAVGPFRPSVRIEKLAPLFAMLFGPRPADAAPEGAA